MKSAPVSKLGSEGKRAQFDLGRVRAGSVGGRKTPPTTLLGAFFPQVGADADGLEAGRRGWLGERFLELVEEWRGVSS